MDLAKPMFHVGYINKVKKILECICFYCSRLKCSEDLLRMYQPKSLKDSRSRLNMVWSVCKGRMICATDEPSVSDRDGDIHPSTASKGHGGCGHRQPLIRREGLRLFISFKAQSEVFANISINYFQESIAEGKNYVSPEKIFHILRKISDVDCIAMGLDPIVSRPEWMILTVLPVPPPPVRPSIMADTSLRSEDDLTYKLADILKANANLKKHESEGSPVHIVSEFEQLLQVLAIVIVMIPLTSSSFMWQL